MPLSEPLLPKSRSILDNLRASVAARFDTVKIAMYIPSASSGGASALHRLFIRAWEGRSAAHRVALVSDRQGRAAAIRRSVSLRGSIDHSELEGSVVVLCPGNRVVSADIPVLWWPLTVAPLERPTRREMSVSTYSTIKFSAMRAMLNASSRACDATIFSSCYARGLYFGVTPRLAEIPSTVVHPSPTISPRGEMESVPGIPDSFVLSVSTLNRYKRIVEIIAGFALAQIPRTTGLVLAGRFPDKSYEAEAHAAVNNLGLAGRVFFVGHQSEQELRWLYGSANSFVFASISENASSYALVDALAHGLPVASSDRSSMPEINGTATVPLNPDDPRSIAEALEAIVRPDQNEKLGLASLARADGLPTWEQSAFRIEQLALSVTAA